MERTASFDLRRIGLLLHRDLAYGYRGLLIAAASAAGVMVLVSFLSMLPGGSRNNEFYLPMFSMLLFAGGFIYTSLSFRELHANGASILYLTLPSSTIEKFASKALVASVGYGAGALVFTTVAAALSEGINWLVFRGNHPLFNPVHSHVLRAVALYLVTQSAFLLGSVYFRKMAFLKTAGLLSLVAIVVATLCSLLALALLRDQLGLEWTGRGWRGSPDPRITALINDWARGVRPAPEGLHVFVHVLEVLFWAACAPVCWVIGYLRMREKEV